MSRYLILDPNNKVTNAIEWDGTAKFDPPKNHTLRLEPIRGNPGDTFNGRNFIPPSTLPKSREQLFEEEVITLDDDPLTTGVFQRFVTAIRNKLGI